MSVACARRTLLRWPNFSNLEGSGATLLAPVIPFGAQMGYRGLGRHTTAAICT